MALLTRKFADLKRWLRNFTLVEIMTVLVIMGIIIAIAFPIIGNKMSGPVVNAGARELMGQLKLARQYAISSRKRVALLLPRADQITDDDYAQYRSASMRIVTVTRAAVFIEYAANTKWEFLPSGAFVDGNATTDFSGSVDVDGISFPNDTGPLTAQTFRAVIFKTTGSTVASSSIGPIEVEEMEISGTVLGTINDGANLVEVTVNWLTGRASAYQVL